MKQLNKLLRHDLVRGLKDVTFEKDKPCSACQTRKHVGNAHPKCRCFPHGGSHQRVNLYACSRFQMVMQKDTKIYPGSSKRRPYVQRGGSLYYFAPKYLYRGEYKCGMEGDGVWKLYYV